MLYEHIEGETDGSAAIGSDAEGPGAPTGSGIVPRSGTSVTSTVDLSSSCQTALAGYKRRASLSRWLQRQACGRVERELASGAVASPSAAVLCLLSGHQLAGATAVASASGDTRLATLVATAGVGSAAREEAAKQLEVWRSCGMEASIDPERLLVYRLLAGQVRGYQSGVSHAVRKLLTSLLM